jgi:1,4-alpha-glucan branching enzyme
MHPGKKLLFMGGEFGQWSEWNHESSLDWHLMELASHNGIARWVGDLNRLLRERGALHELDFDARGFEWVSIADADHSVLSFLRYAADGEPLLVVCNATPVPRHNYRIGVPRAGSWHEILNSDAPLYGGSGQGNLGAVEAAPVPAHGRFDSLSIVVPPLACLAFSPAEQAA